MEVMIYMTFVMAGAAALGYVIDKLMYRKYGELWGKEE